MAVNQLIKWIIQCPLNRPVGAYVAPTYKQAKKVAWKYLQEFTRDIPGMQYNISDLTAHFPNGAEIQLLGGEKCDNLRGIYLDAIVLDEVAQLPPRLWGQIVRPALMDREGKAIFIGTPFGMKNQFYRLYQKALELDGWSRIFWKYSDTNVLSPTEVEAARAEMEPEEFEQEMNCSWNAAVKGAYWGKQMAIADEEGRIGQVPYNPDKPVITTFDLGGNDATVIWYLQKVGPFHHAIRCEAFHFTLISEIARQVHSHGYTFAGHIAPFDSAVFEQGSGARNKEYQRHGINLTKAPGPREVSRQTGINKVRSLIPTMRFDLENCLDGIEALKMYRTKFQDDERQVFTTEPLHDWTSDYADSLRYYAITHEKIDRYAAQEQLDYSAMDQGTY